MREMPFKSVGGKGSFYLSGGFFVLFLLPILLFFVLYAVQRKRAADRSDVGLMNKRSALKTAIANIEESHVHVERSDVKQFYNEVSKALFGYVADKLGVPLGELSKERIKEILIRQGQNDEAIQKLISIIELSDLVQYTPAAATTNMNDAYHDALNTIKEVDSRLKK